MRHNDNEFDQLFRDRLRDHTSPVRADLWRRIHTGIGAPTRRLHFLRHWRYLGAATTTITVAFAAHLIFTPSHRPHPTHPSVPPVNHYSNISHSAATRTSSATRPATATRPDTAALDQTQPQTPTRDLVSAPETLGSTRENPTHPPIPNSNFLDLHRQIQKSKKHNTSPSRANPSTTDLAGNPAKILATQPTKDLSPHSAKNLASTTGTSTHQHYPVTLPAIARTSTRAAVTSRPPKLNPRHNDPDNPPDAPRPIKTGYVSLYASPDFPANHYYTWSYSAGGTVTIQFSRHWSGTTGFEYGRVNVPTQYVPPVTGDTLKAFYWSNYQVPALIGYTMMLGSYALTVNGGAILNLYFHRSTGVWVNNWPDRDSYGAYLGADIFRPVGHSIRVFAQPYARYSISNYRMFIPEQRFFYGAHLGIRYQL
jgi:hypothetical protein